MRAALRNMMLSKLVCYHNTQRCCVLRGNFLRFKIKLHMLREMLFCIQIIWWSLRLWESRADHGPMVIQYIDSCYLMIAPNHVLKYTTKPLVKYLFHKYMWYQSGFRKLFASELIISRMWNVIYSTLLAKKVVTPRDDVSFCDYFYFISPRGLRTGCLV